MKPLALAGLALMVALTDAAAQQRVEIRRTAVSDGTVKISAIAGRIRVIGWLHDSVVVTGTTSGAGDGVELQVLDGATRIHAGSLDGGRQEGDRSASAQLEIRVPLRSHVAVRTVGAAVEIDSVTGGVDIETETGSIRVLGRATRSVYAETAGGDIEVATQSKILRVKSVNGRITVRRALGFLAASTVSGDIRLSGENLSQVQVSSVSGNIEFEGSLERDGFGFSFESHGGNIELKLPRNIRADFEVRALKGRVENAFDRDSAGTGGGRGAPIKVTSFKGRVRISKLP